MNRKPRKWSEEDISLMREKLKSGMTLQQIGDELGITRQRVAQLTGAVRPMTQWCKTYSVYSGIDSWMKFTHTTYAQLNLMLGYAPSASCQANLAKRLMGETEPSKSFIDAMLYITGLTYEEAFKKKG